MSAIPNWTMSGIIPPIRPGVPGYHTDRAPYHALLEEFIERFAISADRAVILQGLLNYRAALYNIGVVEGFQWLNGSFLENVEDTENRSPRDIDVVTFYRMPQGYTQASLMPLIMPLVDTTASKASYCVDGYTFELDRPLSKFDVRQTAYWYSMWSHRRDGIWKGFVQVDLDPATDVICGTLLQQKIAGGLP